MSATLLQLLEPIADGQHLAEGASTNKNGDEMTQCNRVIAAALALIGMSVAAQDDPLSAGQRMAERFLHGDVDAIWSASTPEMQRAFGSAGNLAALHDDLLASFGDEGSILTERTDVQAGHDVYTRVSRWTETSAPLELVIASTMQNGLRDSL